jgi:hypothetical protein
MGKKGVKVEIVWRGEWVGKDRGPVVSTEGGRGGKGGVMGWMFAPCDMVQARLKGNGKKVIMTRWEVPVRGAEKVPNLGGGQEGMRRFLNL